MNAETERDQMIRRLWNKAERSVASAQREFEAGEFEYAVNRIYYAAFYGVSTALLEREITSKKHSGIRAAFHRDLVKEGLVDTRWSKFYDRSFTDRQEGDYQILVEFERDYVKKQLVLLREFLEELKTIIFTPLD